MQWTNSLAQVQSGKQISRFVGILWLKRLTEYLEELGAETRSATYELESTATVEPFAPLLRRTRN